MHHFDHAEINLEKHPQTSRQFFNAKKPLLFHLKAKKHKQTKTPHKSQVS